MFQYQSLANIIFGWGVSAGAGAEIKKYGTKALIVTGRHSTKTTGLLQDISEQLDREGIGWALFDQVMPNPLVTTVMDGVEMMKREQCDIVVGIGGGSIMDASKSIAFMALSEGDPEDYTFMRRTVEAAYPIVLIPTTCGTGSEVNGIAVLSNAETKDKTSVVSPHLVAKASIIDPKLMTTMPKASYASVAFDALCHLMEAYLTNAHNPMTDCLARHGIELMSENLVKVYRDYEDRKGWEAVTWASTLGGLTLNSVGIFAPHGMEHPLSGLRNVTHGKGLAAITPAIFDATVPEAAERFAYISRCFGGNDEKDCGTQIKKLLREIDLCITLEDLGFHDGDLDWLADNCLKVSRFAIDMSPVSFTKKQIRQLYKKSMTYNLL